MKPDYDWIAGRTRNRLPGAALRSIPFAGIVIGCASAYIVGAGLVWGIFLGGAAGFVAYQIVAHKMQP